MKASNSHLVVISSARLKVSRKAARIYARAREIKNNHLSIKNKTQVNAQMLLCVDDILMR
jgi:hypothetical protein